MDSSYRRPTVNTPRLGDGLQARCDVDAVTIEVAALDQDVTQIDTNTQHDAASLREVCIRSGHAVLQLERTPDGVNSAAELDEHTVPCDLEDAALMSGD
jgi:hypothetical protein